MIYAPYKKYYFHSNIIVRESHGVIEVLDKLQVVLKITARLENVIGKYLYYLAGNQLVTFNLKILEIVYTQRSEDKSVLNEYNEEIGGECFNVVMDDFIINYCYDYIDIYDARKLIKTGSFSIQGLHSVHYYKGKLY